MVDATVCHRRDFYLSAKEAAYKAGQFDAGMDANESMISRYTRPELMTDGKLDIQKIILELMGAEIDPLQYHAEMLKYYEAGKSGQNIESVVDAADAKLTEDMKQAAYAAGLQDGGKFFKDLTESIKGNKISIQFFAEKDIVNQESNSLKRALRKYEGKITLHQDKINNPQKYIKDWATKDSREQAGLIKHWQKEIKNFQVSIDDRITELKKRGDYDD